MIFDDNKNPILPPCYDDNFYICQKLSDSYDLINSLVMDILVLEEEMVKWRYSPIPLINPYFASKIQSNIFNHLAERHTNDNAYKAYLDYCHIEDPMESEDHILKLWHLAHGTDEDSIFLEDEDPDWFP